MSNPEETAAQTQNGEQGLSISHPLFANRKGKNLCLLYSTISSSYRPKLWEFGGKKCPRVTTEPAFAFCLDQPCPGRSPSRDSSSPDGQRDVAEEGSGSVAGTGFTDTTLHPWQVTAGSDREGIECGHGNPGPSEAYLLLNC